ncbi:MAG: Mur ligase family protein [Verrucomicrobiota bacterium]
MSRAINRPLHVHFVGVYGRATGSVAVAISRSPSRWRVTGSDRAAYPPMDEYVNRSKVHVFPKHGAHNITKDIDIVVVSGHWGRRDAEVEAALNKNIRILSLAEFAGEFLLNDTHNFVVAGTNGKSTTTALLTWILEFAKKKPNYLIGAMARNFPRPARFGKAAHAVLEGDEFPARFGNRNPKFLYYKPRTLLITNLARDHADVYRDLREYVQAFLYLVDTLPSKGNLILNADDKYSHVVAPHSKTPVTTVGFGRKADLQITRLEFLPESIAFRFLNQDFTLPMHGRVNAHNAAMAVAAARHAGVRPATARRALEHFKGIDERQEFLHHSPHTPVIADHGYHPDSIADWIRSAKKHYPRKPVLVVIQPRFTGNADDYAQKDLPAALAPADRVLILPHFNNVEHEGPPFSPQKLARDLKSLKVPAHYVANLDQLPRWLKKTARHGDLILAAVPHSLPEAIKAITQRARELDQTSDA